MMRSEASRMRGLLSKTVLIVLSVLLFSALGMTMFRAHAAPANIDPDRTDCSIDFHMEFLNIVKDEDGKIIKEEMLPTDGGTLSLYTVGTVKVENGYSFDTSKGKFRNVSGIEELETMDTEQLEAVNRDISLRLEKLVNDIEPDKTAKISDGSASFEGLRPGLYLVAQTELSEMDMKIIPFLISIPDSEGNYHLKSEPKSGKTEADSPYLPDDPTYVSSEESEESEWEESETVIESEPEPSEPTSSEPTPEPPPEPEPPEKLPQTGQLWWPVPILCASGALLILIGIVFIKSGRKKK